MHYPWSAWVLKLDADLAWTWHTTILGDLQLMWYWRCDNLLCNHSPMLDAEFYRCHHVLVFSSQSTDPRKIQIWFDSNESNTQDLRYDHKPEIWSLLQPSPSPDLWYGVLATNEYFPPWSSIQSATSHREWAHSKNQDLKAILGPEPPPNTFQESGPGCLLESDSDHAF